MKLHVVAVGRMRDCFLRESCREYAIRVRRYVKLDISEVRQGRRRKKRGGDSLEEEGDALLSAVPNNFVIVALTRVGHAEDSKRFAKRLEKWRDSGMDVAFLIGGAHGLSDTVLRRAGLQLSLSKMTLPHELARLNLLEQLYRACTIMRGEPYHKGG